MTIHSLASPWLLLSLPIGLYIAMAVVVARLQKWPAEMKLAVAGTGVVLVSVWIMSFDAGLAWARAAYFDDPLTALYPIAIDGEMAVGTITWIAVGVGQRLSEVTTKQEFLRWILSPRPYLAFLVGIAAILCGIVNAAHPYTASNRLPAPYDYIASFIPGALQFAAIHQLVILWRVIRPEAPTGLSDPEPSLDDLTMRPPRPVVIAPARTQPLPPQAKPTLAPREDVVAVLRNVSSELAGMTLNQAAQRVLDAKLPNLGSIRGAEGHVSRARVHHPELWEMEPTGTGVNGHGSAQ